jgi:hypothetical protein
LVHGVVSAVEIDHGRFLFRRRRRGGASSMLTIGSGSLRRGINTMSAIGSSISIGSG